MATRTRTKGSVVAPTVASSTNSLAVHSPFRGWYNSVETVGVKLSNGGYNSGSDNRSTIIDTVGAGTRGSVNRVEHTVYDIPSFRTTPMVLELQDTSALPGGGKATYTRRDTAMPYYAATQSGHIPMSDAWSVAAARMPGFGPEAMSGLNSLYELKDLASALRRIPVHLLWAAYRGQYRKSFKLAQDWISDITSEFRSSPLGALRAVTGIDLAWKFGWKPFLNDVHTVHSILGGIEEKLQRLKSTPFTTAGRYTLEQTTVSTYQPNAWSENAYDYSKVHIYSRKTTKTTWVHGARKLLSPAAFSNIDMLRIAALREFLGLSLDVTDVWEAVPWSFVVDWILPIQTFLEQFVNKQPDSSWFVTQSMWRSRKTVTQTTHTSVCTPFMPANVKLVGGGAVTDMMNTKFTSYLREPVSTTPGGVPDIYVPPIKMPSIGQLWTGMELALQKIGNSR